MARGQAISVQNSFVKGLITEAGPLNFPENACTETSNCVFTNLGTVERRLGFDFEHNYVGFEETSAGKATITYLWRNAAEEGDISFVVAQVGGLIHFYRVNSRSSLSGEKHPFILDLTNYSSTGGSVQTLECQFATGGGKLIVTGQRLDTFAVSYSFETDAFTVIPIDIQIRDIKGDPSNLAPVDQRVSGTFSDITSVRLYDLYNQGWTPTTLTQWDVEYPVNEMPSNADVAWYYKNGDDELDFTTVQDKVIGNSPAPKGHFIYNIYNVIRTNHVPGATDEQVLPNRVTTSAYFAGRIFYGGLYAEGHTSRVWFSQIIENDNKNQYGRCYQVNDPTSEKLFDLLPSDGGTIDIFEAGAVLKMLTMGNALVVWCTNGIWAITGSQGTGFTATDYAVVKIANTKLVSAASFVEADGVPYWWNTEGIYTLQQNEGGNLKLVCITDTTIKTFYRSEIPNESKQFARGVYDEGERRLIWMYRTANVSQFSDKYIFDHCLIFNLITGAFYPWEIGSTAAARVHGAVCVSGVGGVFEQVDVIATDEQGIGVPENPLDDADDDIVYDVDDSAGNDVIIFQARSDTIATVVKYLVSQPDGLMTFAEVRSTTYTDWVATGFPVDYYSYFVSGFAVRGEGARKFQSNYVHIFSESERESSFRIRGRWNYATTGDSGKWSTSQIYEIPAGNFGYIRKRPKIRGHGFAGQFMIDNWENSPFYIAGWSSAETANKWV
jgi:hypothetical protein